MSVFCSLFLFVSFTSCWIIYEVWFYFFTQKAIDFYNLLQCFRHFFFTAMLFVYGRILSQRLVNTVASDKVLYKLVSKFIKYHMVICYFLYIAGLYVVLVLLISFAFPMFFKEAAPEALYLYCRLITLVLFVLYLEPYL